MYTLVNTPRYGETRKSLEGNKKEPFKLTADVCDFGSGQLLLKKKTSDS